MPNIKNNKMSYEDKVCIGHHLCTNFLIIRNKFVLYFSDTLENIISNLITKLNRIKLLFAGNETYTIQEYFEQKIYYKYPSVGE